MVLLRSLSSGHREGEKDVIAQQLFGGSAPHFCVNWVRCDGTARTLCHQHLHLTAVKKWVKVGI